MRPFVALRRSLPFTDTTIRYRGSPHALTSDLILRAIDALLPLNPLTDLHSPAGVVRDRTMTASWLEWYSRFEASQVTKEDRKSFSLECYLLCDELISTANLLFRIIPNTEQGSIQYRSYITKIREDKFICFEY